MNEPKAFAADGASAGGFQSLLSDPLALATKPAVIFKFASSVSIISQYIYNERGIKSISNPINQ